MVAYYYMILYLSRKGTVFIGSVEALPRKSSLLPASTHIERMYAREGKQPYRESLRRNGDCIPPLYCPPSQPILRLLPRVPTSIYSAKVSRAQLSDRPLRNDRASPSPCRKYFSYPAEGKELFLRRKKRLPVVVFFCLRT